MTRESEWDDLERNELLGLAEYERGVCACGFHESLTEDRTNHFTFDEKICPICKGAAQYARIQHAADERATPDDLPPHAPLPGDGRLTYVRRMSATEIEASRSRQEERRLA